MTRKLSVAHKLARLIPAIRKLHDSAREANAQLDQYVQENEKLRSFMENESERYNLLNIEQANLQKKVRAFEVTKNELLQERQKTEALMQDLEAFRIKAARDRDLKRLQGGLFAEFTAIQSKYNKEVIKSVSLKKKIRKNKKKYTSKRQKFEAKLVDEQALKTSAVNKAESLLLENATSAELNIQLKNEIRDKKVELAQKQAQLELRLSEIEELTESLEFEKSLGRSKEARFQELDLLVNEKLEEIDKLTNDMQIISNSRQEQLNRSVELEGLLKEKSEVIENIEEQLKHKEVSLNEHLNRSVELEKILLEKSAKIEALNKDINQFKINDEGSLIRLHELEELLEQSSVIITDLETKYQAADTDRNEHLGRLFQLEAKIQELQSNVSGSKQNLEHSETRFQEQLNRSVELEGLLKEKSEVIENIEEQLKHKEVSLNEHLNRSVELEKILLEKSAKIEALNKDINQFKINDEGSLIRLHELEELLEQSSVIITDLETKYQAADTDRNEHLGRLFQLEAKIQELQSNVSGSKQNLEHSETRFQEQLNRSVELEGVVQDKNYELKELSSKLEQVETARREQAEHFLSLEQEKQKEYENMNRKFVELKEEVDCLTSELDEKNEQLDNTKNLLNDSQHFANIRSEEALARILGKLSLIDYKDSITPLENGTVPLTNYSTQEVVLGKYFDLLIGTLTGTINEDEPISPWSKEGYDPEVRTIGRDWPATACSMIGTVRMINLQRLVCDVIENDVPGDAIETGVWRGGACILMKSIFNIYGCYDRKVWVADSFKGLPEPNADEYERDVDDIHHTFEPLRVSKEQVADNFRKFGVLDENVKFLEGWFKDTLHKAPIDKLAILRLDGDMQESTTQALDALYHKVSKGGYVIIDDYGLDPCRKSVDSFRDKHGISSPLFEVDAACVYWQVQ